MTEKRRFYEGPHNPEMNVSRLPKLHAALSELPAMLPKIGIFLTHKYTTTALKLENLKGADKFIVENLDKNKWEYHLMPVICLVHKAYDMYNMSCLYDQIAGSVYAFTMNDIKYLNSKGPKPQHELNKIPFVVSKHKGQLLLKHKSGENAGNEASPAESDAVYFHGVLILIRKNQ